MIATVALRPSVTYYHGRLWFSTFDGDRFWQSADAIEIDQRMAREVLNLPIIDTPKPIAFGPFVHTTVVVGQIEFALRALDDQLVRVLISPTWLTLMLPVLACARGKIREAPERSFTLEIDPGDRRVREVSPDLRTLPPAAP